MPKDAFVSDYLTTDHRRLDILFEGLVHAVQEDKSLEYQQSVFQLFKSGLLRHIHWEENILFPIFNEVTGIINGPTQVMCTEHSQMRYMLEEIEKQQNDKFDVDYLMALGHFLSSHNEKEETVLYPAIDNMVQGNLKESVAVNISRDFK